MPIRRQYTPVGLASIIAAAQGSREAEQRDFDNQFRVAQLNEQQRQFNVGTQQRSQQYREGMLADAYNRRLSEAGARRRMERGAELDVARREEEREFLTERDRLSDERTTARDEELHRMRLEADSLAREREEASARRAAFDAAYPLNPIGQAKKAEFDRQRLSLQDRFASGRESPAQFQIAMEELERREQAANLDGLRESRKPQPGDTKVEGGIEYYRDRNVGWRPSHVVDNAAFDEKFTILDSQGRRMGWRSPDGKSVVNDPEWEAAREAEKSGERAISPTEARARHSAATSLNQQRREQGLPPLPLHEAAERLDREQRVVTGDATPEEVQLTNLESKRDSLARQLADLSQSAAEAAAIGTPADIKKAQQAQAKAQPVQAEMAAVDEAIDALSTQMQAGQQTGQPPVAAPPPAPPPEPSWQELPGVPPLRDGEVDPFAVPSPAEGDPAIKRPDFFPSLEPGGGLVPNTGEIERPVEIIPPGGRKSEVRMLGDAKQKQIDDLEQQRSKLSSEQQRHAQLGRSAEALASARKREALDRQIEQQKIEQRSTPAGRVQEMLASTGLRDVLNPQQLKAVEGKLTAIEQSGASEERRREQQRGIVQQEMADGLDKLYSDLGIEPVAPPHMIAGLVEHWSKLGIPFDELDASNQLLLAARPDNRRVPVPQDVFDEQRRQAAEFKGAPLTPKEETQLADFISRMTEEFDRNERARQWQDSQVVSHVASAYQGDNQMKKALDTLATLRAQGFKPKDKNASAADKRAYDQAMAVVRKNKGSG